MWIVKKLVKELKTEVYGNTMIVKTKYFKKMAGVLIVFENWEEALEYVHGDESLLLKIEEVKKDEISQD